MTYKLNIEVTRQKTADKVSIGCARISGIINNANFCIIDNLTRETRNPVNPPHFLVFFNRN